jgi:carboxymethylenebutenolidase
MSQRRGHRTILAGPSPHCHRLALVAALALALVAPATSQAFPRFGAGCGRVDFPSGGTRVAAELCRGGSDRAVVVLHGCGGFSTFDHRLATTLPQDGISTYDIDYFARTPPQGHAGFCGGGRFRGRGSDPFPTWLQVVRSAAAALRAMPGIGHVGIVGWSLGGGLAVAASAQSSHAFAAVAAFSTGSFGAQSTARRLPPTILLSAGSTDAIPLSETLPLYRALRAAHVPSALYVYPRGSHDWPGRQGALGIAHAAAFLNRHL